MAITNDGEGGSKLREGWNKEAEINCKMCGNPCYTKLVTKWGMFCSSVCRREYEESKR